jgi:two-component system chemotaxis response regulator CheB
MCAIITKALEEEKTIEVIAIAKDPYDAREKIKMLNPDVITLDIQMPRMDGLDFLDKIMTLRPMPVVMLSSLTEKGTLATLQALERGAVDYHAKFDGDSSPEEWSKRLREKVINAANAKVTSKSSPKHLTARLNPLKKFIEVSKSMQNKIICIGSSTGGVEALNEIIPYFPPNAPPTVIVQHMPPRFTESFAKRLNSISHVNVQEAGEGDILEEGTVYIAPGGYHMRLDRVPYTRELRIDICSDPSVSGHKPSVDVLFSSCAAVCAEQTVAAILTGMGRDGAKGMKLLHDKGAITFGQSAFTCVVYGMPKAAFEEGGIKKEIPLNQIATYLLQDKYQEKLKSEAV